MDDKSTKGESKSIVTFLFNSSTTKAYSNDVPGKHYLDSETWEYLEGLSDDAATTLLPVIVLLAIFMIIGVVGNLVVLYVHLRKFNPSTTRNFVMSLAVFDLLSCCIAIPGEIVDLRYSFTFDYEALCKAERFTVSFCSLSSGYTLMFVAIDRYRRICHPLKNQLRSNGSLKMVAGAVFLSLLFSWPGFIIYGIKSVKTERNNVRGYECSTDESLRDSKYPTVYNGSLFITFIASFTTMTVLYILIGRKVYSQKKFRKVSTSSHLTRTRDPSNSDKPPSSPTSPTPMVENDRPSYDEGPSEYSIASMDAKSPSVIRKPSLLKRFQKSARDSMTRKTTFMLFLITLVFVISFLPHLILKAIQNVKKDLFSDTSAAGQIFYNIFVRSYFFNSFSNAFIYGFCSPRFRKECRTLLETLICAKKCGSFTPSKS